MPDGSSSSNLMLNQACFLISLEVYRLDGSVLSTFLNNYLASVETCLGMAKSPLKIFL